MDRSARNLEESSKPLVRIACALLGPAARGTHMSQPDGDGRRDTESPGTLGISPAVEPLILDPDSGAAQLPFPEPARFDPESLNRLLLSAAAAGVSDITMQTDAQPRIEVEGKLHRLGSRTWPASEISAVLCELHHASNAAAEVTGRRILDFSHEIPSGNGRRQRFRVNATGINARDGFGIEISIRVLPTGTPDIGFAALEQSEVAAMTPPSGLVLIAGATGSGKSATMAAMTRHHLENGRRAVKIVDIQAPIEYTFRDVLRSNVGSPSLIGQSEVGRHLPDFASGVWSALRRKPHIINVGEARDVETISAALEAALTGHLVYTTTHAGSVHDCIRRLLSAFPAGEREHRACDLGISLRFVMVQHLVHRADGNGRIPLREWLSLSGPVRESLLCTPPSKWPEFVHGVMTRRKDLPVGLRRTLKESALDLIARGLLSLDEASRQTGLTFGRR